MSNHSQAFSASPRRKARPERIRVTLRDEAAGGSALPLPRRRLWPAGLVTGVFFVIFASIAGVQVAKIGSHEVRGVFDLTFVLFEAFWVLGWSVGVLFLGALTVLLLFHRESARIDDQRLLHVPGVGPISIVCEYDLAKIANLRLEPTKDGEQVRIRFDYNGGRGGIGDRMDASDAERIVEEVRRAVAAVEPRPHVVPQRDTDAAAAERAIPAAPARAAPSLGSPSSLALVGANLLPLVGVLAFGWDLAHVMVLYWAESAVVGFYTVLRMFVLAKLIAVPASIFFVGHFGGFMAAHFMFVYALFVRGIDATGPEPPVGQSLLGIFGPLWAALLALAVSHGVSFVANFIGRREYEGASIKALMMAPYRRIFVMHLTIIFGGWLVMLLGTPVAALLLLVVLKTAVDARAHAREHARLTKGA